MCLFSGWRQGRRQSDASHSPHHHLHQGYHRYAQNRRISDERAAGRVPGAALYSRHRGIGHRCAGQPAPARHRSGFQASDEPGREQCVHLGWDLVRWKPTLEAVVIEIKTRTALRGVTRLFTGVYLVANLPGGTEMGCDRVKWPPRCQISARQAVTEMAVCALRDFLVGSPFTFWP
ncbi:uncharacterized protein ACA1_354360 [Acanthamoeba castellanii str. Neff]|uniref:Uncharacterized protein n=1 Tax=Acanthamoeba castellanii (strain ATCC 30010 / Neff) TaxID=1257118 RepID=L8GE53_ACACF|nr:uncharacterized protein ACA1_354360 [Acanthamoeba castellanii str. Neff]ELR10998.1 hypothetical protein ACA1_354360 [Acanthamoeba castellanii str. Neff]